MRLSDFEVTTERPNGAFDGLHTVLYKPTNEALRAVSRHTTKRGVVTDSEFGDDLQDWEYVVMRETLQRIAEQCCTCNHDVPGFCAGCAAKDTLEELEL